MFDSTYTGNAAEDFAVRGFIGPFKAVDEAEVDGIAGTLLSELARTSSALAAQRNRHLDWDRVRRLTVAEAIVDRAEQLLGPDLVLWRTNFFVFRAGDGIRWHHDEYKSLLADTSKQLSIQLGITPATEDNCLLLFPGSHAMTQAELASAGFHAIAGTEKNLGGTNFWRDPAGDAPIVKMTLRPGEFFIFHPRLLHASYDLTESPDGQPTSPAARREAMPRVGLTLRVTVPHNEVFPAAFAETRERGDRCVPLREPQSRPAPPATGLRGLSRRIRELLK
jgi:hypothetical protein